MNNDKVYCEKCGKELNYKTSVYDKINDCGYCQKCYFSLPDGGDIANDNLNNK